MVVSMAMRMSVCVIVTISMLPGVIMMMEQVAVRVRARHAARRMVVVFVRAILQHASLFAVRVRRVRASALPASHLKQLALRPQRPKPEQNHQNAGSYGEPGLDAV
jgi:hypothetical protein